MEKTPIFYISPLMMRYFLLTLDQYDINATQKAFLYSSLSAQQVGAIEFNNAFVYANHPLLAECVVDF